MPVLFRSRCLVGLPRRSSLPSPRRTGARGDCSIERFLDLLIHSPPLSGYTRNSRILNPGLANFESSAYNTC